jgi:hypothetical protein
MVVFREAFFIHPFVSSSNHGWHHTGKKTLIEINNPPPLRMCGCLGKACPALGGGTPKILIYQYRCQFPVRVAFGVYLSSPVFYYGQLYVAISQVTCSANIKIFSGQGLDEYMRNVVYRKVLIM